MWSLVHALLKSVFSVGRLMNVEGGREGDREGGGIEGGGEIEDREGVGER